jgi:hypothetical protein
MLMLQAANVASPIPDAAVNASDSDTELPVKKKRRAGRPKGLPPGYAARKLGRSNNKDTTHRVNEIPDSQDENLYDVTATGQDEQYNEESSDNTFSQLMQRAEDAQRNIRSLVNGANPNDNKKGCCARTRGLVSFSSCMARGLSNVCQ